MKKNVSYLSKSTLNLAMREKRAISPLRLIPLLILILALVAAFGKFAVMDRLALAQKADSELTDLRAQIARAEQDLADYDQVADQYAHYSTGWMTEEEKALVDRVDVLDLIEKELMSVARVRRFSMSGSILTVELSGMTLDLTSQVVENLYAIDQVQEVTVYNASSQGAAERFATIMITLSQAPQEGGGAA